MGLSFEELLLFNQGEQVDDSQFYTGRSIDIWINPKPRNIYLSLQEEVLINQESIKLTCTENVTLYRNEVIRFYENNEKVIVKGTVELKKGIINIVPIYRAKIPVPLPNDSMVYGMTPLISAKEGGFPQISVTYAEAHNKNMGLYAVSQQIKRDATVTITGDINFTDPSLLILKDIQEGYINKLFVQIRHSLIPNNLGIEYGEGGLALEYWEVPTVSLVDNESGFVSFQLEGKVIGSQNKYIIPTGTLGIGYCLLDVIYMDLYAIDYELIPEEDSANYCPLRLPMSISVTLADGYCPIDIYETGFVIEKQTTLAEGYCEITPPEGAGFTPVVRVTIADGYCENIISDFDPNVELKKPLVADGFCPLTTPIELTEELKKVTIADGYCELGSFVGNEFVIVKKVTIADGYCELTPFI